MAMWLDVGTQLALSSETTKIAGAPSHIESDNHFSLMAHHAVASKFARPPWYRSWSTDLHQSPTSSAVLPPSALPWPFLSHVLRGGVQPRGPWLLHRHQMWSSSAARAAASAPVPKPCCRGAKFASGWWTLARSRSGWRRWHNVPTASKPFRRFWWVLDALEARREKKDRHHSER